MAANTKQENTAPSRASALPPTHTNESVAVAVRACGDHSNIKLTYSIPGYCTYNRVQVTRFCTVLLVHRQRVREVCNK